MAEYLASGVYIQQFNSAQKPIEVTSPSIAGFIGMAQCGPVNGTPLLVTSYGDFQKKFGEYLPKDKYGEYRYLPMAVEQFFLNGGTDCYIVRLPDTPTPEVLRGTDGGTGNSTGLCAFKDIPEISIIAAPGITEKTAVAEIVAHCESMGNRVCILDMPQGVSETAELQQLRGTVSSSFAAMYYPWIQAYEPLEKCNAYMPPSGAVAGIYARVDKARGVHKAPANETINGCTGLQFQFGNSEQNTLSPLGINLIKNLPGQGIRVWGARTCSNDAALKYINVRRLVIYLEKNILNNMNWVIFEPNDQNLWTKISSMISSFLSNQWKNGALMGSSESEAFYINIGLGTSMTQDDVENGKLICEIGVAPVRPREFITFKVTKDIIQPD